MAGDNFKPRLQALLKSKGMTIAELADKLGVSRTAIDVWKEDKKMPSYSNVVKLSKILEVSCDYLMMGKERGLSEDEDRLITIYRTMSPELKDFALEFLNLFAKKLGDKKAKEFLEDLQE